LKSLIIISVLNPKDTGQTDSGTTCLKWSNFNWRQHEVAHTCKTAPHIYRFQHLFLPKHEKKFNITKQYPSKFYRVIFDAISGQKFDVE